MRLKEKLEQEMGASASLVGSLESLSAEDIGKLVAQIGPAYEGDSFLYPSILTLYFSSPFLTFSFPNKEYKITIINEGINGVLLAKLSDAELKEMLSDLGITKGLHVKNICAQFEAMKKKEEEEGGGGNNNLYVNTNTNTFSVIIYC